MSLEILARVASVVQFTTGLQNVRMHLNQEKAMGTAVEDKNGSSVAVVEMLHEVVLEVQDFGQDD